MAAAKKGPPDLALLLAEPAEGEEGGEPLEMAEEPEAAEGDELPAGFQDASDEYDAAETPEARAQALYRAFKLCEAGGL